jgi:hypothetical protein
LVGGTFEAQAEPKKQMAKPRYLRLASPFMNSEFILKQL